MEDYSNYIYVYNLKIKSDIFGRKLRSLEVIRGRGYDSYGLNNFIQSLGVIYETAISYFPSSKTK